MKKFFILFSLLIVLLYTCNIANIPTETILFQDEKFDAITFWGLSLNRKEKYDAMQTAYQIGNGVETNIGKIDYSLKLFNIFPLKDVTIDVIPKTEIIPIGRIIGLKLYTKGILVVGLSDNARNSEIKEGDIILSINKKEVSSTEELVNCVSSGNGNEIEIKYDREGETKITSIKPSKNYQGEFKLGLWVRDATAGVGTITYFEPDTKTFVALGHGIQDVDTDKLITIENGQVVIASIVDIIKGKKGNPR